MLSAALRRELGAQDGDSILIRVEKPSAIPLESLGLSRREAEVLLWIAQGKNNEEIGIILGAARNTIKKHVMHLLEKLGVESRNAAAVQAIERLSSPKLGQNALKKNLT